MTVAVVVPLHLTDDHRARAWEYVREHYETSHPWPIICGASTDNVWSKGAVVNRAIEGTAADRLVIADADCIIDPERLAQAVAMLEDAPWVVPHSQIRRLTEESTTKFIAGHTPKPLPLARAGYQSVPGGGIFTIRRDAFDHVRGFDERFLGWGGEDWAFGQAMNRLVGRPEQLRGPLWHLWHPRNQPKYPKAGRELLRRYRVAARDPEAMRRLIDERSAA